MNNRAIGGSAISPESVGLNCGTLVAIAFIVFFFSGFRQPDYATKLQGDLTKLREQAEAQTAELQALRKLLEERLPPVDAPAVPEPNL